MMTVWLRVQAGQMYAKLCVGAGPLLSGNAKRVKNFQQRSRFCKIGNLCKKCQSCGNWGPLHTVLSSISSELTNLSSVLTRC